MKVLGCQRYVQQATKSQRNDGWILVLAPYDFASNLSSCQCTELLCTFGNGTLPLFILFLGCKPPTATHKHVGENSFNYGTMDRNTISEVQVHIKAWVFNSYSHSEEFDLYAKLSEGLVCIYYTDAMYTMPAYESVIQPWTCPTKSPTSSYTTHSLSNSFRCHSSANYSIALLTCVAHNAFASTTTTCETLVTLWISAGFQSCQHIHILNLM